MKLLENVSAFPGLTNQQQAAGGILYLVSHWSRHFGILEIHAFKTFCEFSGGYDSQSNKIGPDIDPWFISMTSLPGWPAGSAEQLCNVNIASP